MKRLISLLLMLLFAFVTVKSSTATVNKQNDSSVVTVNFSPAKVSISSDMEVQKQLISLEQEKVADNKQFISTFTNLVMAVDNLSNNSPPLDILIEMYKIPKEQIISSYNITNRIYQVFSIISLLLLIFAIYKVSVSFSSTPWTTWLGMTAGLSALFFIVLFIVPYAVNFAVNHNYYHYQELLNLSG
jgi:hypothetical protein